MRKPSLKQVVYNALIPHPGASDPTSFTELAQRYLCREVRSETQQFYGNLGGSLEALYPGLDYTHSPHRMRLSRFQWHSALFKVFDDLRLTDAEISSLCTWERTKAARERYEKEFGVKVRDTTGEGAKKDPEVFPSVVVHFYVDERGNYIAPAEQKESDPVPTTNEPASGTTRVASETESAVEPIEDGIDSDASGDTEPIDDRNFSIPSPPDTAGSSNHRRIRVLPPEQDDSDSDLPLPHWMYVGDRIDPMMIRRASYYLTARTGSTSSATPELLSSLSPLPVPPWTLDGPNASPEQRQRTWNHLRERLHMSRQREVNARVPPGRPRSVH